MDQNGGECQNPVRNKVIWPKWSFGPFWTILVQYSLRQCRGHSLLVFWKGAVSKDHLVVLVVSVVLVSSRLGKSTTPLLNNSPSSSPQYACWAVFRFAPGANNFKAFSLDSECTCGIVALIIRPRSRSDQQEVSGSVGASNQERKKQLKGDTRKGNGEKHPESQQKW